MAQRKTLTEAQLGVLRWIGEGCPEGVMPEADYAHRISAAALARRGLVSVSGRGPTWSAAVMPAGRDYIDHADGPDAPRPRQPNVSVTQQLVDDVIAAGGALRFPERTYLDRDAVDYRKRAALAERHGKVPPGKQLVAEHVAPGEVEIKLIGLPDEVSGEAASVPVPDRVARYHPVVRRFRDGKRHHEVSRAALQRAIRILQGLVSEAERRGYGVDTASADSAADHFARSRSAKSSGHIAITVNGHSESLWLSEEGLPSRAYWERQNRQFDQWTQEWKHPPITEYEAKATGRLQIEIVSGYSHRQSKWADRKSWTLEEKLPDVLQEIELRAVEAEERREEAEREEAERKREWEAAMRRAKERWLEAHRAQKLREQLDRWRETAAIRAFCSAAEEAHGNDPATTEWVGWARSYADSLDPLASPPTSPAIPESIRTEELRPYLEGWDPHGPTRGWR